MIKTNACAGTLESSDIYVEIAPLPSGSGVVLSVTSVGETDVKVTASDRGAVDCTIAARVETAVCRGKGEQ